MKHTTPVLNLTRYNSDDLTKVFSVFLRQSLSCTRVYLSYSDKPHKKGSPFITIDPVANEERLRMNLRIPNHEDVDDAFAHLLVAAEKNEVSHTLLERLRVYDPTLTRVRITPPLTKEVLQVRHLIYSLECRIQEVRTQVRQDQEGLKERNRQINDLWKARTALQERIESRLESINSLRSELLKVKLTS